MLCFATVNTCSFLHFFFLCVCLGWIWKRWRAWIWDNSSTACNESTPSYPNSWNTCGIAHMISMLATLSTDLTPCAILFLCCSLSLFKVIHLLLRNKKRHLQNIWWEDDLDLAKKNIVIFRGDIISLANLC